MKTVEIFDPALCCSSGVCGPSPDEALASFAGVVERLKAAGVAVERYNLAQQPMAFAAKAEVKAALEKDGEAGLPLVFVNGELRFSGAYPSADQLSKELEIPVAGESEEGGSCCCGSDDDCCREEPRQEVSRFVKVEAPKLGGSSCCDSASGCC